MALSRIISSLSLFRCRRTAIPEKTQEENKIRNGLTSRIEASDLPLLISIVTDDLETICQIGNSFKTPSTIFNHPFIPKISIEHYIERIMKFFGASEKEGEVVSLEPYHLVIAIILLTRVTMSDVKPVLILNSASIHRSLLTAFVLAIKCYDDLFFKNEYYAKVGGVPTAELNKFEIDFLQRNYNLFISETEYLEFEDQLLTELKKYKNPPQAPGGPTHSK